MIWISFGVMLLAAALIVAWPLYRAEKHFTPGVAISVAVVLGVAALMYSAVGTPVPPAPQAALASVGEMVAALDERLRENPNNVNGWKMLGRSYMELQDYPKAVAAFERVVELETPASGQSLAELGEALMIGEGSDRSGRAAQLFDSALAVEPGNAKALFYGGVAAIDRGDRETAADRWEKLLAQSPPPEIEEVLRQRVAEWRGLDEAEVRTQAAAASGTVAVNVSLSADAAAAVSQNSTVYIIARDPAQPSPPVAAARRVVSELPAQVSLSDADSMIPGRSLSAFDRLEIVARVSRSGEPVAQPGDWYGAHTVSSAGAATVDIVIERQVE